MTNLQATRILYDFLTQSTPIDRLPQSDAIFVFGHNDYRVADQAAKLYHLGKAPKIIVTGGVGPRTKLPVGYETEAQYYAATLAIKSVPQNAVILEDQSTNTLQNVQFGISVAKLAGLKPCCLIAIAMPPLLRRSIATIRQQYPKIKVVGSTFNLVMGDYLLTERKIARLRGEVERLIRYAEQGDIAPTVIPDEVLEAYKHLKCFGAS